MATNIENSDFEVRAQETELRADLNNIPGMGVWPRNKQINLLLETTKISGTSPLILNLLL